MHNSSALIQAWRQKHAANNKLTINCQVADIAEGLAFDHRPYNAIIDKVSSLGKQGAPLTTSSP